MAKLFYVGFNGYNQCPKNDLSLDVINKWYCTNFKEFLNIACTHKFVVIETRDNFNIFGMTGLKACEGIKKIFEIDNFGSNDDFLVVSRNIDIWQYDYDEEKWEKLELTFVSPEEKIIWEKGNKIKKFSFRVDISDVILLIDNGSVWLLSKENTVQLLFPYEVEKAIDIASGLEHTLILTESGCVLSFGNGSRGQLGHGDLSDTSQPIQIEALEGIKITKIAAGGWHSAAITDTGGLYVWGWNNHGQLSVFEGEEKINLTSSPVFVEVGPENLDIVDVACGNRHTVVKLENGEMYATGWNFYSQLGVESSASELSKFTTTTIVKNQNRRMICGPWYTILLENLPENLE